VSITELLTVLFPQLACVCIERVAAVGSSVRILARTRDPEVGCPGCGVRSDRVHSRYERRVSDTAISGRETVVRLRVRRFFCGNDLCPRKTFAEQVPGLTVRYGRRSVGLGGVLRAVALALGGRPGARLADRLGAAVSRMTLLRLLRGLPEPTAAVPRVLGVDDFALRRGHRYGTVLVDIEAGHPIEILTDRSADSLAAWLQAHPGVEVICRDRAGAYAEAATRAAPNAVQVADRWHLWHNLGEALERTVAAHRRCLAEPDPPRQRAPTSGEDTAVAVPAGPVAAGRLAQRTQERHAAIHGLLAEGHSLKAVARELRLARGTVRRFARAEGIEELLAKNGTGRRPSILTEHKPYLHQRWNAGVTNAATLFAELRERGFEGSYQTVRDYVAAFRSTGHSPAPAQPPAPPTVRETVGWIMCHPDDLDDEGKQRLTAILDRCPQLRAAHGHVGTFAEMIHQLGGRDLEKWMKAVDAEDLPALRSFVTGLRRDQDAVTAGLTLPWNSGPVEGHVNRIKTIKRQMYGRANPDLLRIRVLHGG
jgi:transposase